MSWLSKFFPSLWRVTEGMNATCDGCGKPLGYPRMVVKDKSYHLECVVPRKEKRKGKA